MWVNSTDPFIHSFIHSLVDWCIHWLIDWLISVDFFCVCFQLPQIRDNSFQNWSLWTITCTGVELQTLPLFFRLGIPVVSGSFFFPVSFQFVSVFYISFLLRHCGRQTLHSTIVLLNFIVFFNYFVMLVFMLMELNKSRKNCVVFLAASLPLKTFSADGIFCVYRYFIVLFLTFHQGPSVHRICPNTYKTTTRMTSSTISTWTGKRWRIPPASVLPPVRAASRLETPSTASRATTTPWRHKIIPQTNSVFTVTGWTINQVFKTNFCAFFHDKLNYQPALLRLITRNVYSTKRQLKDWMCSLKKFTSNPSFFCGIFFFYLLRRTISVLTTISQLCTRKFTALFRYRVFFPIFLLCMIPCFLCLEIESDTDRSCSTYSAVSVAVSDMGRAVYSYGSYSPTGREMFCHFFPQAARFCQYFLPGFLNRILILLGRSSSSADSTPPRHAPRNRAAKPEKAKSRSKHGSYSFFLIFFPVFFLYAPIDRVWLKWIVFLLLQVLGAIIYGNSFGIYWRTPSSETKSSSGRTRKRAFSASSSQKRSPKCGARKNAIRGWRMRSFPERWGEFVHLMCFAQCSSFLAQRQTFFS